ncbi:cupin [Sphingomonas paucimobilis]|jgi:hypothetical protein|uniref:cupin n=1 Tax=Sphingomonas paucimobilis TaxID=13689 RepID=UPI001F2D00DA|nr:cupin [Sphingomonas paucimobilis]
MIETEQFILHQKDWVPNNERLPVIVYRGAVKAEGKEAAEQFERLFTDHGWPPQWRDTVYGYHHYHSTAHEALGVATGFGTLLLGGPGGREIEVRRRCGGSAGSHWPSPARGKRRLHGRRRLPAGAGLGHLPRGAVRRSATADARAPRPGGRPDPREGRPASPKLESMTVGWKLDPDDRRRCSRASRPAMPRQSPIM